MNRRVAISRITVTVFAVFAGGGTVIYLERSGGPIKSILDYLGLISALSEIIVPKTDTPGAKDANISNEIVTLIKRCLPDRDRKTVLKGLSDVENYSMLNYEKLFVECSVSQKVEILTYFQKKGIFENKFVNKIKNKIVGPSFFELIKNLTVRAYCTSYVGATYGLAYEHVPGNFIPCTSMHSGQHCWATS